MSSLSCYTVQTLFCYKAKHICRVDISMLADSSLLPDCGTRFNMVLINGGNWKTVKSDLAGVVISI